MTKYNIFTIGEISEHKVVMAENEAEALDLATLIWPDQLVGCYVEPTNEMYVRRTNP